MSEVHLISQEEEFFIQQYNERLRGLQEKAEIKEETIFTAISMPYAVAHKLYILNLIFHPLSVKSKKSYLPQPYMDEKLIIENIIIYETTRRKIFLTSEELLEVIKHFRKVQNT